MPTKVPSPKVFILSVKVSAELRDAIDDARRAKGIPKATFLRGILERGLAEV